MIFTYWTSLWIFIIAWYLTISWNIFKLRLLLLKSFEIVDFFINTFGAVIAFLSGAGKKQICVYFSFLNIENISAFQTEITPAEYNIEKGRNQKIGTISCVFPAYQPLGTMDPIES